MEGKGQKASAVKKTSGRVFSKRAGDGKVLTNAWDEDKGNRAERPASAKAVSGAKGMSETRSRTSRVLCGEKSCNHPWRKQAVAAGTILQEFSKVTVLTEASLARTIRA